MASPQPGAILDTIENTIGGQHAGIPPTLLSKQQVAFSVNITHRGGKARTRPALVKRTLSFADDESDTNATAALFQRASYYQGYGNNPSALVALIGGRLFRYVPQTSSVLVSDVSPPGAINNPTLPLAWLYQGEEFLIVQNLLDLPIFFDGASTRRSAGPAGKELPNGGPGTYNNGRIVMTLPDQQSYIAGDLVYNTASGTPAYNYRDSILKTNDNLNILAGRAFAVPINAGRINAMFSVADPDTSLGQGPLQIGTRRCVFGVHLPLDATLWTSLDQPTQVVSLPSAGPLSQDVAIVNMDGWYRSRLGIQSYQIGRRDMGTWVQTALSSEVQPVLKYDTDSLLEFSSAVEFDNRLLMTVSPHRVSGRGITHRGLVALDFHNVSSLTLRSTPDYEGLWTGLEILQIVEGSFAGTDRCFIFALDGENKICLYELLKDGGADFDFDGEDDVLTESWLVSNALFGLEMYPERIKVPLKKLLPSDMFMEELAGAVAWDIKFRSDAYPFWVDWKTFSTCATECETPTDCSQPLPHQYVYATFKRLPEPPDTCNPATGRLHRTGYYFQLRVQWTGHAALDKLLAWAIPIQENINSVCVEEECKVISGCLDDWFTYNIEPCGISVTTQPESQALDEGNNLELTVASTGGSEPVTVQWYKDGAVLTDGGNVSGSATTTLTITTVTTEDAGTYYAVFTDSSTPACTARSSIALVQVGEDEAIFWDEGHTTPTPPTCEAPDSILPLYSQYGWGLATDQNPNEELSADQLANALALFFNERTIALSGYTPLAYGALYWAYYPGSATALSGLHKAASGSTDPTDPTGNQSVLFNGYYYIAQDVCVDG